MAKIKKQLPLPVAKPMPGWATVPVETAKSWVAPTPHYIPKPRPGWPDAMPKPFPVRPDLPRNLALVHQHGYTYVYQVENLSRLPKKRGRQHLLLVSGMAESWRFAQGLVWGGGWQADTFHCSEFTNDLAPCVWSRKLEENPYYLMMKDRVIRTETEGKS